MVQTTGEQVVTTDVNYKLNKTDDKVIALTALTATMPDNPTIGESHMLLASGGDILVVGGQFPLSEAVHIPQGSALWFAFTGTQWVPAGNVESAWTNQVAWFVNPATGDDANSGASPAQAVRTLAEVSGRLSTLKYGSNFGPYQIEVIGGDVPATDTFNLSSHVILTDQATNPANSGVPRTLVRIFSTLRTVLDSGVTAAFLPPAGNAKSTVTRAVGVFAPEDIIEFTSGPAAGKRVYAMSGGAAAQINPYLFDPFGFVFPTLGGGDTFDVIRLRELNIQLPNAGGPQGILIDVDNFKLPPAAGPAANSSWEFYGYQLRFLNCLLNVLPRPGMAARLRLGKFGSDSCGVMRGAQDFFLFERGTLISLMTSFRNVIFDVTQATGIAFLAYDELQFGAIRMGNTGEEAEDVQGAVEGGFGPIRVFDWPDPIPANPYIGTGGTGDPGAAISTRRGAPYQLVSDSAGNVSVIGTSAVGAGMNISQGAQCEILGATPTVTGVVDLIIDAGADIPSIGAGGVPVAGVPITTWAQLDGAPYGTHAHNLKNGTKIFKVA
jgi:hypothetical protein